MHQGFDWIGLIEEEIARNDCVEWLACLEIQQIAVHQLDGSTMSLGSCAFLCFLYGDGVAIDSGY